MELRAVARRCPSRSMTVLGDLAQATAPGAQSSWEDAVVHLGSPRQRLDRGARARLPRAARRSSTSPTACCRPWRPACGPARSVRLDGPAPAIVAGRRPTTSPPRTAAVVAALAAAWGSVGVIAPVALARRDRRRRSTRRVRPSAPALAGGLAGVVTLLRPARGQGPRVRRRRGGRAGRGVRRRARRAPAVHRAHPGRAGAGHRPRPAAPRRAGRLTDPGPTRRQYARRARRPPVRLPHRAPPPPPLRLHHRRRRRGPGRHRRGPRARHAGALATPARSDEAPDRPRARSTSASYVYAVRRLAAHHPAGRDRPAAGAACRRSRRSRSTRCSAVEDADFYAHDGVNLRSTLRALVRNVDEGETVQGGSTITQQVVKAELGRPRRPSTARRGRRCWPGASRS